MIKKLSLSLFVTFLALSHFLLPSSGYAAVAVDWETLGFPQQITSETTYDETILNYHVRFTPKQKDELGVFDPTLLHSITGGGTPPISNATPFPAFDVNVTANSSNPKLEVLIEGTTATDFVLAPGQYLYLGGFDTNAVTSIQSFQFSQVGGGSVAASNFVATTTYEVNGTDADALTWDPAGADLDYTPSMGTTGVIFLRNDSGLFIDSIKFEINYTLDTSFYFGVTTPEPSTYLTLAGMALIVLFAVRQKRKKDKSDSLC